MAVSRPGRDQCGVWQHGGVWRERPGVWGLQEAGLNRWASTGREGAWPMLETSFGGSVQEWCNDNTALIKEARSVRIISGHIKSKTQLIMCRVYRIEFLRVFKML